MLAAKSYEAEKLSPGQAAELTSMSKISFAEILYKTAMSLLTTNMF